MTTLQSSGEAAGDSVVAGFAPWFHNLHLPNGVETAPDHPLGDFPAFKWAEVGAALPADLDGLRVLDIGCNAGFYSFALAQRGAKVLGIDHDDHYLAQARWARSQYELDDLVELRQMGVYDLARLDEVFDLILFMGVFYHLRHPLLALDIVTDHLAPSGQLVFQTLTAPGDERVEAPPDLSIDARSELMASGWPAMSFIEHRMADDPTNWWLANESAVEAMLRSAGVSIVGRPGHEIWLCQGSAPNPHREELLAAVGRLERR